MSISPIGSLGHANDKNTSVVIVTVTPARTVPVGRLLVAWVAWDSVFDVFSPSNFEEGFTVYDTGGNVWTNIAARTDTQGFFATGGWAGILVTQITTQLTTSDTITVQGREPGNLTCKAVSIEEFDIGGAGFRWAQAANGYAHHEARIVDPPAMSFDMQYGLEWLELHCLATEGPNSDSYTWDTDWTQIAGDGTTGGSADSNITLRGGYRIATESSTSVDVSNGTATRDNSQVLTAIGVIVARSFPTTPLIDNFNRANENPLDGGLWNTAHEAFGSLFAHITSNAVEGGGGSFLDVLWERCGEAYVTIADYSGVPLTHIFAGGDSTVPSMFGHGVMYMIRGAGLWTQAVADGVFFGSSGNDGSVQRGQCLVWAAGADGVKWGLKRSREGAAYVTRLWLDLGSGWEEVAAIFLAVGDSTTGAPAIGVAIAPTRLDDFGGGQVQCPASLPQFIRRPWRYKGVDVDRQLSTP